MKRKEISDPERLSRFVHSLYSHSQDFKGLTLKLLESGQSTAAVSALTGVSSSTLYDWIKEWNEKRSWLSQPPGPGRLLHHWSHAQPGAGAFRGKVRQMQRLASELSMYCYKPQPRDYRHQDGASCRLKDRVQAVADVLRMRGRDLSRLCIGFADESSHQLYGNAPYSPDLNPIERIWKQVKKAISEEVLIKTLQELEKIVSTTFESCASKFSFARSWIENIYNQIFINHSIPISDKLGRSLYIY